MRTKTYNKKKMLSLLLAPVFACSVGTMAYAPNAHAACPGTITGLSSAACTLTGTDSLTVTNTGSLNVTTNPAVYIDAGGTGVTINNSGDITSTDYMAIQGNSAATGIAINNLAGGTIAVTGSITTAIFLDGDLDGSLSNTGIIQNTGTVTDTSTTFGLASATASTYHKKAIDTEDLSGSLNNSGEILATIDLTATADGTDASAYADGSYATAIDILDITASGSLVNTGDIIASISGSATATGVVDADATVDTLEYAYAINIIDLAGSLNNSGNILAVIDADASATATGFGGTGSANASVDSAYSASGIHMGDITSTGSLTNSGTIGAIITADAVADGTSYASGYVYYAGSAQALYMGDLDGSLNNSGSILADIDAFASASASSATGYAEASVDWATYATALTMDDIGFDAVLNNSGVIAGSINATAVASGVTHAYATIDDASSANGIIAADINGSLVNSGDITASIKATAQATASGGYADASVSEASYAYGLDIDDVHVLGSINNSGTISAAISASATAVGTDSASAYIDTAYSAYGIYMDALYGSLDNSGTISASIDASATATAVDASATIYYADYAYGIQMYGDANDITNSGTISASIDAAVTANGVTDAYAYATYVYNAYGIEMYDLNGTLNNTGSITGDITATSTANASGNGTTGYAWASVESAYSGNGIDLDVLNGSLVNSGSITGSVTASADAIGTTGASAYIYWAGYGYGLYMDDDLYGSIDNSGVITGTVDASVTATGEDANASIYYATSVDGVNLDYMQGGSSITNTGTISGAIIANAEANGVTDAYASVYYAYYADGLDIDSDVYGTIDNSGTISASIDATATATATGNGTTGDASAYMYDIYSAVGIDMNTLRPAGSINNSGTISGSINAAVSASGTTSADAYISYLGSAYGIYSSNSVYGDIINSGTISSNATGVAMATADDASATVDSGDSNYGLYLGTFYDGARLINTGTISAAWDISATANGVTNADASVYSFSDAVGVYLGDLDGTFDNSGTISATMDLVADATATGNGTTGAASATVDYAFYATGVDMGDIDNNRTFTNSGIISAEMNMDATASGTTYAYADVAGEAYTVLGIDMNELYGTLENSGTISAAINLSATATALGNATNGDASASADSAENVTGIKLYDIQSNGLLVNSGTISASMTASATAVGATSADATIDTLTYVRGIDMDYIYGVLDNSGTITASMQADAVATAASWAFAGVTDSAEYVYGIENSGIYGTLRNSGMISASIDASAMATATGNGSTGDASATIETVEYVYGIESGSIYSGGRLDNNGTISASINAEATAIGTTSAYASLYYLYSAYGLYASTVDGTLDNSGTISASMNGVAKAQASGNGTDGYGSAYIAYLESATGVYMSSIGASGNFTNSGTISASMTGLASAQGTTGAWASVYSAYSVTGVNSGSIDGTFNNSGTITALMDVKSMAQATGNGTTGYATAYMSSLEYVYGVDAGTIGASGSLINSGTISATMKAELSAIGTTYAIASLDDYAEYVYGINVSNIDGLLDNSGTITAAMEIVGVAEASAGSAYAEVDSATQVTGIDASTIGASGSLVNSGTISASIDVSLTANGLTNAYADIDDVSTVIGIYASSIYGTLANSGSVTATMNSIATATATGDGTTGYASATAENSDATGIEISGTIFSGGSLTNSGTITVENNAEALAYGTTYAEATAYAEYVRGIRVGTLDAGGSLTNSGTINVMADASAVASADNGWAEAWAYAYDVNGVRMSNFAGDFVNSGTIAATGVAMASVAGTSSSGSATASVYGVYATGGIAATGTLTNTSSGVISAVATASGNNSMSWAGADAYGVYLGPTAGTIDNSGLISASAMADGATSNSGEAYGVYVSAFTGTLDNSGTISGTASTPGMGYSLYLGGGTGTGIVSNMTSGLLSGNLFAGGNSVLINKGTIELPSAADASIGFLYNQDVDAVLSIGVGIDSLGATEYASLTANQVSMADGTTIDVNMVNGAGLTTGDQLDDVVSATAALAVNDISTFTVTDNSALYEFTAILDVLTIDLGVERELVVDIVNAYGQSGSAGAAALIDDAFDNGAPAGFEDLMAALSSLGTPAEVASAINQLVPFINGDGGLALVGSVHDANRVVHVRQKGEQGLNSGDEMAGGGNVWGKLYGSAVEQDANNGAPGYDADTFGLMIGVDKDLSAAYKIGAAIAYSQSDIDGDFSDGDVDSFQAILYGNHAMDSSTALNWQASYGIHNTDTTRNITMIPAVATGSYDSWTAHLGMNLERDYIVSESTMFTPGLRAEYTHVSSDGYTESGAGALNLIVDDNDVDELIIGVDGELTTNFAKDKSFSVNLGLGYDALADEGTITAAWAGAPTSTFNTRGIDNGEIVYTAGAGLSFGSADALQFDLRYDLDGREDLTNQTVSFKINKSF